MTFDLTMKPRAVEAYLRDRVKYYFGDAVENAATINSSHGYYYVALTVGAELYSFGNFRKRDVPRIVKGLKAISKTGTE